MKLNNILENKTNVIDNIRKQLWEIHIEELPNKFIAMRPDFYISEDGTLNQKSGTTDVIVKTINDKIRLFDDTGKFIVKFGTVVGLFSVSDLNVRSVKNFPHTFRNMKLERLLQLETFDLEIKSGLNIYIEQCGFTDLSNIKNTRSVSVAHCSNIHSFDKLPHNMLDEHQTLLLNSLSLTQAKTNNNNIRNLALTNIKGIHNCKNLPSEMQSLSIYYKSNDFKSYIGIDEYKNLTHLGIYTHAINNIITLLLCKGLSYEKNGAKSITLDKIRFVTTPEVLIIMETYLKKSDKEEHIMDCAIELIDAGYEEAAEL